MTTHAEHLPESYSRYLVNGLRQDFDLQGTPIRFTFRDQGSKNPFKGKKKGIPSRLTKHVTAGRTKKAE